MLRRRILLSLRYLKKYKSYTLINILGLALALVPVLLTIIFIQYEFSYDKHNKNYNNIYRIVTESNYFKKKVPSPVISKSWSEAIKNDFPEIVYSIQLRIFPEFVTHNKNKYLENNVCYTDPDFFKMFSVDMIFGSPETALSDPNNVLISQSTSKKYFGNFNPLNKTISIGEFNEVIIKGVYKDLPVNSHFKADFILSKKLISGMGSAVAGITSGGITMFLNYVLINPKADVNNLSNRIEQDLKKYKIGSDSYHVYLQPLSSIHLYSNLETELSENGNITTIILYAAIAFIILIIAIINYVNLATGRSLRRSKEIAMKKIIGAGKIDLLAGIFYETLFLTFVSFLISLFITLIVLSPFGKFVERDLSFAFLLDLNFLGVVTLLIILISITASLYPAYVISSVKPLSVFRKGNSGTNSRVRNVLVVVQFVFAISLIFITTVVKEQLNFISKSNLGHDRDNIIVINRNSFASTGGIEILKSEIEKNPNVVSVSSSFGMQVLTYAITSLDWDGKQSDEAFRINYNKVDFNFLDLYGMKIIQGRSFSKDYTSDIENAAILNETAVKNMGLVNPIGTHIMNGKEKKEVIGVVRDFNTNSLKTKIPPFFFTLDLSANRILSIKIKQGSDKEVIAFLKDKMKIIEPGLTLEYKYFNDIIANRYRNEQRLFDIFSFFSIFSIIVASIGLFGLVSFTSEARKKEIGIRKVTGASSHQVAYVLFKEIIRLVIISSIISAPIAYYSMQKWLDNFAYKADINLSMFVLSAFVVYFVSVSAMAFKVYNASRQNPVDILKCE